MARPQDGDATPGAVCDIGAVERVAAPDAASPGYYHPVTPSRILDTRDGTGGVTGKVGRKRHDCGASYQRERHSRRRA